MEPENRRYVDSETEPGDAGIEAWADTVPAPGDPVGRGPLADPVGTTDDDGVVDGSPADEFINDPDAIGARSDQVDRAWGVGWLRQPPGSGPADIDRSASANGE